MEHLSGLSAGEVVVGAPLSRVATPRKTLSIVVPASARPRVVRVPRRIEPAISPTAIVFAVGGACLFAVYILLAIVAFLLAVVLRDVAHALIHLVRAARRPGATRTRPASADDTL